MHFRMREQQPGCSSSHTKTYLMDFLDFIVKLSNAYLMFGVWNRNFSCFLYDAKRIPTVIALQTENNIEYVFGSFDWSVVPIDWGCWIAFIFTIYLESAFSRVKEMFGGNREELFLLIIGCYWFLRYDWLYSIRKI